MSRLLLPPVAAVPGTVEDGVMHLVPVGETKCVACGLSKFRMRFHYTDEPTLYTLFSSEESVAMYDPVDRMMKPYTTCRREHGRSH